jgi:phage tail sheath gpL-like
MIDNVIPFPVNQKKDPDKLDDLAREIAEVSDAKYVIILTKGYDDRIQISCLADELDPFEIISMCSDTIHHTCKIIKDSR